MWGRGSTMLYSFFCAWCGGIANNCFGEWHSVSVIQDQWQMTHCTHFTSVLSLKDGSLETDLLACCSSCWSRPLVSNESFPQWIAVATVNDDAKHFCGDYFVWGCFKYIKMTTTERYLRCLVLILYKWSFFCLHGALNTVANCHWSGISVSQCLALSKPSLAKSEMTPVIRRLINTKLKQYVFSWKGMCVRGGVKMRSHWSRCIHELLSECLAGDYHCWHWLTKTHLYFKCCPQVTATIRPMWSF